MNKPNTLEAILDGHSDIRLRIGTHGVELETRPITVAEAEALATQLLGLARRLRT
jgi:hypothetical protein